MRYLGTGARGYAIRHSWTKAAFVAVCCAGAIVTWFDAGGDAPVAFAGVRGQTTISTTATLTGFAVAYLVFGRWRHRRLARDLVLSTTLLLLATSNLFYTVVPAIFRPGDLAPAPVTQEAIGLVVAVVLSATPWLGDRVLNVAAARRGTAAALVVAGLVFAVAWRLGAHFDPQLGKLGSAATTMFETLAQFSHLEMLMALFFGIAALGWLRLALVRGDSFAATLALGSAMAAFSRLNFALAMSPTSERVVTGSMFRLGFYLLLLAGSAQEIRSYWQESADVAVLEERRRISRDLHDGLAQELSFLARRARSLGTDEGRMVAAAAERALDESRRAIAALSRPLDEPLDVTITQAAEEVANRVGLRVLVDTERGLKVSAEERETLVRIVRESLSNAGRHGRATSALVQVSNHHGVTVSIMDNGSGFDPEAVGTPPGRFGLLSMRERAEALGGKLTVESRPHRGTSVTVHLP